MTRNRKLHPGVSLIELLTAIAIVAVLATIVLSVVFRVQETAMGVKNANNHRTLISGLLMYAANNDGMLPLSQDDRKLSGQPDTDKMPYTRLLAKYGYLQDPTVIFSPHAGEWYKEKYSKILSKPNGSTVVPWAYTNYAANRMGAMPRLGGSTTDDESTTRQLNIAVVEEPSRLLVLRDTFKASKSSWIPEDEDNRGGGEISFSINLYYPPSTHRYMGRVYASFLDGHIEAFDGDELFNLIENNPRSGPPLYEKLYTRNPK